VNSTDLRELAPLFDHLTAYRAALTAARERVASCDCRVATSTRPELRRYQLAGRCKAAKMPPPSCQTVVHLGIRTHLATIAMPVDHLSDSELDDALVDTLHGLVLTAARLSRQDFVDQLRVAFHAERVQQTPADHDGAAASV